MIGFKNAAVRFVYQDNLAAAKPVARLTNYFYCPYILLLALYKLRLLK
jgi:hypothetical protein